MSFKKLAVLFEVWSKNDFYLGVIDIHWEHLNDMFWNKSILLVNSQAVRDSEYQAFESYRVKFGKSM